MATRIDEKINIDGNLTEKVWSMGKPVTGFIQYTPDPGKPASEPTKVTVLYDDAAVYIGFMCYVLFRGERLRHHARRLPIRRRG